MGNPFWRLAFGAYVGYRAMSRETNLLLKDLLLKYRGHFKSKSVKSRSCADWIWGGVGFKIDDRPTQHGKFREINFATSLSITIRARLTGLFAPHSLDFNNTIDLDACFALLRNMRNSDAMTILKTWTNSWATPHRSHDPGVSFHVFLAVGISKNR